MGKVTGFIEIQRQKQPYRPVAERLHDWREVYLPYPDADLRAQASRCMDCGIPFCHQGCPLGNLIPDWNDFVYRDRWEAASERLHATNNFPEWTGRLCPAPCEGSCVLGINDSPVTIKAVEATIAERAFDEGWVVAASAGGAHRQARRRRRIGARGPRGRRSVEPRRPLGHGLRARGSHRRAAALRHPGVQAREEIPGAPADRHARRRRDVPDQRQRRRQRAAVRAARRLRGDRARRRLDDAARPEGARARAQGHLLRDGVPDAAEQALRRRLDSRGSVHLRRGQGRRDHRRRRYGRRLPGHGASAGRAQRAAARTAAASAGGARREQSVAALAEHLPRLVRPRRGRRADVLDLDRSLQRRRAAATSRSCTAAQVEVVVDERPDVVQRRCRAASSS